MHTCARTSSALAMTPMPVLAGDGNQRSSGGGDGESSVMPFNKGVIRMDEGGRRRSDIKGMQKRYSTAVEQDNSCAWQHCMVRKL